VKRWTLFGGRPRAAIDDAAESDDVALGVEAAQPALQARHWPGAPTTDR